MYRLQVPGGAAPLTDAPGPPGRNFRRALLLAGSVVVADQVTKAWAVAALSDGPVRIIGDTLMLRLTRNPGGAFSVLPNATPLLAVLAVVMSAVIYRVAKRSTDRVAVLALGAVLGGAVGNLLDRFVRDPGFLSGHVVDFIRLSFWPTFNVADIGISIGAVVLLIRGWRE